MKKYILPIFLFLLTLPCFAEYVVNGNQFIASKENRVWVYLLNGLTETEISYTYPGTHQWYEYSLTKEYEPISCDQVNNTSTITGKPGFGYFVRIENTTDTQNHDVWLMNYSAPAFNSITIDDSDDKCNWMKLYVNIDSDMEYKSSTSSIIHRIPREYNLNYSTMEWNNFSERFESVEKNIKISSEYKDIEYTIDPAPLQDTYFELSGDQYAAHFGLKKSSIQTPIYGAVAVKAEIITDSIATAPDNEMSGAEGSMSAPADYTFTAYANEPVAVFYLWKIYNLDRSNTESVTQTTNKILRYTFQDTGRYRVDLEVSNANSLCTYKTSITNIAVSDFKLWVPNAFSPTSSPGVNDIFKVAYKSVVKFDARIFNQWGNELFHWTDPSQGWDGKYRGKYVPPGTYFYIIEATSANGKRHIRKGDVNIIGGR